MRPEDNDPAKDSLKEFFQFLSQEQRLMFGLNSGRLAPRTRRPARRTQRAGKTIPGQQHRFLPPDDRQRLADHLRQHSVRHPRPPQGRAGPQPTPDRSIPQHPQPRPQSTTPPASTASTSSKPPGLASKKPSKFMSPGKARSFGFSPRNGSLAPSSSSSRKPCASSAPWSRSKRTTANPTRKPSNRSSPAAACSPATASAKPPNSPTKRPSNLSSN